MDLSGIEEAVEIAQRRWPGFEFRIQKREAHGPCPICGQADEDGFILWENGRYLCRPGGCEGWLDEDEQHTWTKEEIRLRRIEAEQARAARERLEIKRRLSALEQLNQGHDHIDYHKLLDATDRQWWHDQGIIDASIDAYQLGVCYNCPTDSQHRPSYTIPIYDSHHTALLNIRHRLMGVVDGDRYRPHMAGLPGKALFNSELVHAERDLYLAEGCKKAIVLTQHGIPAMGVLGKYGFNLAWLKHFSKVKNLTLCPDPDAIQSWQKLGQQIVGASSMTVRVCSLPMKPDDLFIAGGTVQDFEQYLKQARRIH